MRHRNKISSFECTQIIIVWRSSLSFVDVFTASLSLMTGWLIMTTNHRAAFRILTNQRPGWQPKQSHECHDSRRKLVTTVCFCDYCSIYSRCYLGKLLCVDKTIMYSMEKHNSPDSSSIINKNNFVQQLLLSLAKKYFEFSASQFAISVLCEALGLCIKWYHHYQQCPGRTGNMREDCRSKISMANASLPDHHLCCKNSPGEFSAMCDHAWTLTSSQMSHFNLNAMHKSQAFTRSRYSFYCEKKSS